MKSMKKILLLAIFFTILFCMQYAYAKGSFSLDVNSIETEENKEIKLEIKFENAS